MREEEGGHGHIADLKEVKPELHQSSNPPTGRQETIWENKIHPQDQPLWSMTVVSRLKLTLGLAIIAKPEHGQEGAGLHPDHICADLCRTKSFLSSALCSRSSSCQASFLSTALNPFNNGRDFPEDSS